MDYTPFIGKPFQVISKLQARYTGIFDHIDQAAQTICLAEVYNHGTENRQSPHFLPGTDQCLGWVKFHTDSIHAISIPENYVSPAKPQAPQDPILASVSQSRPVAAQAPVAAPAQARAPAAPPAVQGWVQDQAQQKPTTPSVPPIESPAASSSGPARQAPQPPTAPAPTGAAALPPKPQASYPPPSARRPSKTEAIDRVQQSISDLSIRAGSRQPLHATPPAVPDAEFDFASANAKFKKASAPPPIPGSVGPVNEDSDSESEATEASPVKPAAKLPAQKPSYNKSSFFDNISTDSSRVSRADERHRNLDTFGEAVPASALNGPQAGRGGYGYGGRGRGGRGGGGHRGGPRPTY